MMQIFFSFQMVSLVQLRALNCNTLVSSVNPAVPESHSASFLSMGINQSLCKVAINANHISDYYFRGFYSDDMLTLWLS
jgi:hypothetical protein